MNVLPSSPIFKSLFFYNFTILINSTAVCCVLLSIDILLTKFVCACLLASVRKGSIINLLTKCYRLKVAVSCAVLEYCTTFRSRIYVQFTFFDEAGRAVSCGVPKKNLCCKQILIVSYFIVR